MHDAQAHALRRGGLVAAGLVATIVAHMGAVGGTGVRVLPVAPFLWCGLVAIAVVCGPRARAYAPRGALATFVALGAAQLVLHLVATVAPWALGLDAAGMRMPATDMLSVGALWPHLVAALVLGVLLVRGDCYLARIVGRMRDAVVALVAARPPRPRPLWRMPIILMRAPARPAGDVADARGPPRMVIPPV